jgi:hypothetical protein
MHRRFTAWSLSLPLTERAGMLRSARPLADAAIAAPAAAGSTSCPNCCCCPCCCRCCGGVGAAGFGEHAVGS